MTDDSVTITLTQFEQKLFIRLNELRQENRFCDIRFEINGRTFPCHRLVMIAISPYFDTMFNGNFKESSSDTIPLKEIEADIFEEILNAIYTTKLRLHPSNAYLILKASHSFLLETIEKACIAYIVENSAKVHYLVDICLFANNTHESFLRTSCETTISKNLIDYGQTNSFMQMPMDHFKSILSKWKPKEHEEAFTVTLIWEWSKQNQARREDVQMLLESTHLKSTKFINSALMAQFLMPSDDTCPAEITSELSTKTESNFNLDFNLYLNVIDEKTGQKGWGVLKINDKFDTYILSSFHPTHSSYKSVCKVGSKFYCFEYFSDGRWPHNEFSCYDGDMNRTFLPTPTLLLERMLLQSFKIVSMGTSIYLMTETEKCFIVWVFDCELNSWKQLWKKADHETTYDSVIAYTFFNGFFYFVAIANKWQHMFCIDSQSLVVEKMFSVSGCCRDHIYGFDNKLAICSVRKSEDRIYLIRIFDIASKTWLIYETVVKVKFENFRIFLRNDFLYIMENEGAVINQKYDLKMKTITDLPSLPKRVTFRDKNDATVLVTRSVFGSDSDTPEIITKTESQ